MTISRIKWIAIVAPILFLLMIEEVDRFLLHPHFGHSTGYLFKMSALIAGAVVFSALIFRAIERVQQSLVQRNRELLALDEIGRTVTGSNHLHQELTVALDQVIRVTSSIAGRVLVEGYGESDPPTYVSLGDPEAFAGLPEDDRILSGVNSARTVQISVIHEPLALATRGTLNEHTAALVPLVALDRTIGSLRLVAAGARLAMESERLLTAIGHQLGVAVQASHLFRDVERRREESQALYELGLRIASLEDPERVLDIVVDQARRLLAVDRAGLCMAESSPDNEDSSFHDWESKHVTRSGAHVEECSALAPEYRRFSLTSPLRLGGRTVGQLSVGNRSPRLFSPRDRIFLDSIADMAAIALSNARLLRSERQVAVLEERERISRELHDSSSQALGYLHLKCLAVARTAATGQLEPVEAELRDMASVAKDAYADVREAILGLREASPAGGTFVETVQEYVERFERQSGIRTAFRLGSEDLPELSREMELQVIRVVQEALTNVRKHSGSTSAWVAVALDDSDVLITIGDRGKGFDPRIVESNEQAFGVRTMRERIERAGGRLTIESRPGVGTQVKIRVAPGDGGYHDQDSNTSGRRSAPVS